MELYFLVEFELVKFVNCNGFNCDYNCKRENSQFKSNLFTTSLFKTIKKVHKFDILNYLINFHWLEFLNFLIKESFLEKKRGKIKVPYFQIVKV